MADNTFTVHSDLTRDQWIEHCAALYDQHKYVTFSWKLGRQRTNKQNNSLWKWCDLLAEALNDAGFDMILLLSKLREGKKVEIPWSKETVKERLWAPVQEAMTSKASSAALERAEVSAISKVLSRHISQTTGLLVEWPHEKKEGE